MKNSINKLLEHHSIKEIENAAIKLFLDNNNINKINNKLIAEKIENVNYQLYNKIKGNFSITDINSLDKFFENLFNEEEKIKNGIIFTPEFIADYIIQNTIIKFNRKSKIIDPSCGCGIFLIVVLKHINSKYHIKISDILKNNLYGIDLKQENIYRVKILLSLFAITNGEDLEEYSFNLICEDSLFCDWSKIFNVHKFNYIVGNPPYINNHDLNKKYICKLKNHFQTTQEGVFNIFYAFIEKSTQYITEDGTIGYIIPNNFLYIKSALKLRRFIKENQLLNTIIDFKDNTLFSPTLTYNCIVILNKNNQSFNYCQIYKASNVNAIFKNMKFYKKNLNTLNDEGWYLTSNDTLNNLKTIESYNKLDKYIKTGIATLRDKLFILDGYDQEKKLYYKIIKDKIYYIEPEITKPFIKISKYKTTKSIDRIIFPYSIIEGKAIIYDENTIKQNFPLCYKYFTKNKTIIEKKDKGILLKPWYAYGRTQGLNMFGEKIIFSTFSNIPKFMDCPSNEALLSNGYCLTNFTYDKHVLLKILNSDVMKYYIENTSYSIAGNFKCFQKKYIKNFSIPELSKYDIQNILMLNNEELNKYLFSLYKIDV